MTAKTALPFNVDLEASVEKVADYNQKVVETSKDLTGRVLDSYEMTALRIADFQDTAGERSNVKWISVAASKQAHLTRELTSAYTSAARGLLK